MAKTKYKEYFQRMLDSDPKLFEEFRDIHQKYLNDDETWQEKFNEIGAKVQELAYEWENRLCHQTEGGQYAKYSGTLAEKFQAEIKKEFSMFDHIGLKVRYSNYSEEPEFQLKKINLN